MFACIRGKLHTVVVVVPQLLLQAVGMSALRYIYVTYNAARRGPSISLRMPRKAVTRRHLDGPLEHSSRLLMLQLLVRLYYS